MTRPEQVDALLSKLRGVWMAHPSMPLTAVIFAAARLGDYPFPMDAFKAPDEPIEKGLDEMQRIDSLSVGEYMDQRAVDEKKWREEERLRNLSPIQRYHERNNPILTHPISEEPEHGPDGMGFILMLIAIGLFLAGIGVGRVIQFHQ